MNYSFLVDTYATERLKTLNGWSMFRDNDMDIRPHPLFAKHLSGNNFIGFRTEAEHAMVINGKLRFALASQEPVGMTFHNSGERNAYLMDLRQQVDHAEARVWWNIKSGEYDSCIRTGGRSCQNPGPRP